MRVSIIMTPYNRDKQLQVTMESIYAQKFKDFEVVCVEDDRERVAKWMNPAPLLNRAIRQAKGDILILQNAENKHVSEELIENISRPVMEDPGVSIFAACLALNPDGTPDQWYCHSVHRRKPWYFCQAVSAEKVQEVGGFNENFTGYGGEDVDFAKRLEDIGVRFVWRDDILVHHQWHEHTGGIGL